MSEQVEQLTSAAGDAGDIEAAYKRIKNQEEEISAFVGYLANVKKTATEHLSSIEGEKSKATKAQEDAAAAIEASKGASKELTESLAKTVSNANTEIQEHITAFRSAKEGVAKTISGFKQTEEQARDRAQQLDTEQNGLQERIEAASQLHGKLIGVLETVQAIEAQTQETKGRTDEDAKIISELKNSCEKLKSETYSRAEEATAKKNQLEEEFKSLQEAITNAQKTLADLAEGIKNEKAAASTITAGFQQQFSEAQEKRLNDFNAHMKKLEGDIETFRALASSEMEAQSKRLDETADEKIASLTAQVESALQSMDEKNHKASKLLEAVGVKAHTYSYAAVSEKEGKTADKLRMGALIFMAVAIAILVAPSVVEALRTNSISEWKDIWQSMLMRLPVSLVLFIPAWYLISESSKHRTVQKENKRIELELAALTPYLELFEDSKKQAVKEQLVKNYFVGHGQENKEQEKEEINVWVKELVPKIAGEVIDHLKGKL